MTDNLLESIEIDLFLQGIYRRYGYDFQEYAYASLRCRLLRRMQGFLALSTEAPVSYARPSVDKVLSIDQIAPFLMELCRPSTGQGGDRS